MWITDAFGRILATARQHNTTRYEEPPQQYKLKGEVFMRLRDAKTGELQDERHVKNLIVKDASILIARLVKNSAEPPHGAFCLAVGTGDIGWNPMSPPAPNNETRALFNELTRKTFSQTQFINGAGVPVSYPTNVVDFTATFTESEAVGPLVEMGIIGGNVSSNMAVKNPVPAGAYDPTVDLTQYETLLNHLTFAVLNKPATSTFQLVWRLTF